MLRLYTTANPTLYKDFESNLFSKSSLHSIAFNYVADTVTIDTIDYVISKIEEITNEPDQSVSTTIGAVTVTNNRLNVVEQNSAAILAALASISGGGNPLLLYEQTSVLESGTTVYLGHEKIGSSKWYISKFDGEKTIYARGDSDFATAWANKQTEQVTFAAISTYNLNLF